ncbi:MAG TPA: peptidyl-prolyl cis-trans isomerase [Gaiella sp.]|nr:peptidyl-prolyl cis-trans isomerase [Gaiella sp.]
MKRSLALAAVALAAVTLVAAGCGDSDEVPADAVAVVDGTTITRSSLDGLLSRAKKSYTAQKRAFPKAGTSEYQSLQTQAVAYLVQREEYAREAEKLGIDVTDQQIAKKVDEVKKQYFGGSQAKFDKGLADQGYTKATLEEDIRSQLLTEGIYKKVTTDAKVTDADVKSYYEKNRANYTVPESRSVRHILVKSKADADRIRTELVNGGDFAALAKANSIDPGSKDAGGKLTVSKGQTVAPFDKAAFSLDTNELSQPIKTQFGYHLIQPLAAVKAGSVTPFAQVKDQIKTQLESETKNTAVNKWVADVEKEYKGKVQYAAGFEPPDTSTTTGETTTSG